MDSRDHQYISLKQILLQGVRITEKNNVPLDLAFLGCPVGVESVVGDRTCRSKEYPIYWSYP